MRLISSLAAIIALTVGGFAQDLVISVIPPASAIEPGATIDVAIALANPAADEAKIPLPAVLKGALFSGERSWEVELHTAANPRTASIPPHGFAQLMYRLAVPADVDGRVVLEIQRPASTLRTGLLVSRNAQPVRRLPDAPMTPLIRTSIVAGVQRSFFQHFDLHDPIYFIYGPDDPAAKFQFSFKYRVLTLGDESNSPYQRTLQFGYTQRSLWDIERDSSPFYDTSYIPSLFYQSFATVSSGRVGASRFWMGYQAGYQHESNGRAELATRSTDQVFVRPVFLVGPIDRWHLIFTPRISLYVDQGALNENLEDYRGYVEWQFVFGRNSGPSITYTGRAGKDFNHLTTQFDLAWPLRIKLLDFGAYFHVQYFEGYGESLRDYNRSTETVRAGISLVR